MSAGAPARRGASTRVGTTVFEGARRIGRRDDVVTEEPLQIRVAAGPERETLATTMRTPGNDFELAAGWLHAEGVVSVAAPPPRIDYCTDVDVSEDQHFNTVTVWLPASDLAAAGLADTAHLHRTTVTASACGVCGRDQIADLVSRCTPVPPSALPSVAVEVLYAMPDAVRGAQAVFSRTGGLHAAAACDASGVVRLVREDVGRHNAVDKLVGRLLLDGQLPAHQSMLFVSGRTSFEIVQKAAMAGFALIAGVSAPSSLAVDLADELGITLVGFLRGERLNAYTHAGRITGADDGR